jgi:phosphoribosylformylglycinamidine synthase subunit PurL
MLSLIGARLVRSAHDCSEGGLACALAEAALGDGESPFGVSIRLNDPLRPVGVLFGEAQGRIVVSCAPESTEEVLRIASRYDVPARRIGSVREAAEGFTIELEGARVAASLDEMADAYFGAIPAIMDTPARES